MAEELPQDMTEQPPQDEDGVSAKDVAVGVAAAGGKVVRGLVNFAKEAGKAFADNARERKSLPALREAQPDHGAQPMRRHSAPGTKDERNKKIALQAAQENGHYKHCGRLDAENELEKAEPGAFILRPGSRAPLALTYRAKAKDGGQVTTLHFEIQYDGKYSVDLGVKLEAESLRALLGKLQTESHIVMFGHEQYKVQLTDGAKMDMASKASDDAPKKEVILYNYAEEADSLAVDLPKFKYFHDGIENRDAAEKKLADRGVGSYLLRWSSKALGAVALDVVVDKKDGKPVFEHIRFYTTSDGKPHTSFNKEMTAETIPKLVGEIVDKGTGGGLNLTVSSQVMTVKLVRAVGPDDLPGNDNYGEEAPAESKPEEGEHEAVAGDQDGLTVETIVAKNEFNRPASAPA